MNHIKKRVLNAVIGIVIILVIILWGLGLSKHWLSTCQKSEVFRPYDFRTCELVGLKRTLFSDDKGHLYMLDHNRVLYQYICGIPIPIRKTDSVVPMDNGIAFSTSSGSTDTISIHQGFKTHQITDKYSDFCWDGSNLLFFHRETGAVYCNQNGEDISIAQFEQRYDEYDTITFLASEQWIILASDSLATGLQVFDRKNNILLNYDVPIDNANTEVFIAKDKLIMVGWIPKQKEMLEIIDLSTGEIQLLDINLPYSFDWVIDASAAYDERQSILFISACSAPMPYLCEKKQAITIAVNLEDSTYEELDDHLYSGLFLKKGILYGIRNALIVRITESGRVQDRK